MTLLDPSKGYKPLDFGSSGIAGSIDMNGRIIALNTYHPEHGFVTLTSAEPFREEDRYNPEKVRAYRKSLVNLDGFGFHFDEEIVKREVRLLEDAIPKIRLEFANGGGAEVTTFASGATDAVQYWDIRGVTPHWSGRFGLYRSAYTQLTEGGPVPDPPLEMILKARDGLLIIENPNLDAAFALWGLALNEDWERKFNRMATLRIDEEPGRKALWFGFHHPAAKAKRQSWFTLGYGERSTERTSEGFQRLWQNVPSDPILRRGLCYSRAMNISRQVGSSLITDHMLLPLSWNRDAYYVALAELYWGPGRNVFDHLKWLFKIAERSDGFWARSYMANGKIKDPAFQLDQQLFPLLEYTDFVTVTSARLDFEDALPEIDRIINFLMMRKADHALLISTDETPADDPIALPYHLSSHILMWRTFTRLSRLTGKYGDLAAQVKQAVNEYFVAERDGRKLYAYATDGVGNYHFYHDANDFPLALAPAWGFCSADDPVWRATIDFAFSPDNVGGYYDGRLGSVHTPAAWALGDVQDMIIARAMGDKDRENRAREYLQKAAQWDGALPEAYDPKTGEVVSRHWFAWPNAAYACFELGAFDS